MAAASLIAIGKTAANSADQVVTAGAPITFALMTATGEAFPPLACVRITLKDSNGIYNRVGELNNLIRSMTAAGPGTYRAERATLSDPNSSGVGVFSG